MLNFSNIPFNLIKRILVRSFRIALGRLLTKYNYSSLFWKIVSYNKLTCDGVSLTGYSMFWGGKW